MSDHNESTPETDDEIRSRLRTFAHQVAERADTEAALRRMSHHARWPGIRLLTTAACLIALMALIAIVVAEAPDRESSDAADPSVTPIRQIAQGVVEFVEADLTGLIGVPPDGGLSLPAGGGLGGSTLDISVQERNGQITGRARFLGFEALPGNPERDMTVEFDCAGTDSDDVILGGIVTASSGGKPRIGEWVALLIREGDPDRATVWWDSRVSSCRELLESVPYPRPDDRFIDVAEADDIETSISPP